MEALLEVQGLCKTFKQGEMTFHALKNVNLKVNKGEFVVVMGPSGSGKSTFLHVLGGLEPLTSGKIMIERQEIKDFHEEPHATRYRREKIGFVFQFFNLLASLTAVENISLPLVLAGRSEVEANREAACLLELVGLRGFERRRPAELSGGQQQRVALARGLVHRPQLLLADEPTGSLDSKTSEDVLRVIVQMKKTLNQSIIMVTHDPMVATYGDRIVFFRDGSIVGEMDGSGSEDRRDRSLVIYDRLHSLNEDKTA
ncbi:putative ABC transport system ATP-binding protein [Paenibacillus cellulosilyticus]|uniref:Putative ABC transport system ATP-binding protein n=1 Tax=Paenibacillus cellulosilyticus TaxID=375489 RepID=A0A2V2YN10_9BACL|nr:ABC transporter ATP-binding protein [Paenibacillus cellulosilyticus]PWV95967.1 putative ABC transport system ATP-binding protein [Paenibacillus cellulosilyticus]QKS48435.1 ABC transporter ATP-binding protein [Paenibacillus cellulosilyticus]